MVKAVVLVAGSLLLAGAAQAQVGVRVGGSLAPLYTRYGDPHDDAGLGLSRGILPGWQAGLFYEIPLSKRLSLVPELQYSWERTSQDESRHRGIDSGLEAHSRLRFAYLNVPVLLRAALGRFYAEAGVQGSYQLGGRQTGTAEVITIAGSRLYDIDEQLHGFRRFDVGPCLGAGATLPSHLSLSLRFYQGLVSITPEANAEYAGYLYRQTLQASLTYQLPARQ